MRHLLAVLLVGLALPQAAFASLLVFTDRTAWGVAAAGTISTEDFNALGPVNVNFPLGVTSAGLIGIEVSGTTSSGNGFQSALINPALAIDGTTYVLGNVRNGSPTSLVAYLFSSAVGGFGADWVGATGFGNLTFTVADETVHFDDHLPGGTGFLGLISSTPFTRVDLAVEHATTNEAFGMDNLSFFAAPSARAPSPGSLALLLPGLLALGLARRRKRVNQAGGRAAS